MTAAMEDKLTAFWGGFSFSLTINVQWIWLQVFPTTPEHAASEAMMFAVKVFATLILGVIGGIAGMAGKDLYKAIKDKINKP